MNSEPRIPIDHAQIAAFCQKWKIVEFSLFGSVLTDEFRPDSDVDVLVTFAEGAEWSLFDIIDMEEELSTLYGRPIDLSERCAVEKSHNHIRRSMILNSARSIYAA